MDFIKIENSNKREKKGNSLIDFPESYVSIDIETTGLSPLFDEIIELAAVRVNNGDIVDRFGTLVKPQSTIPDFIEDLTGITNEMVADAPHIEDVIEDYVSFISDSVIVGHNVNFDINFIYDNYLKISDKYLSNDFVDTLRMSRHILPELPHHRLTDLVETYNIKVDGQHRAMYDCEATKLCFDELKKSATDKFGSVEAFKSSVKPKCKSYDLRDLKSSSVNFDESNPFFKKNVVFTGTLERMVRKDAAQLVVDLGGTAQNGVNKDTDFLVLGNNDYCKSIKDGKSSKQKKAESLILKGKDLKIIPEDVFYEMLFET